MGLCFHLREVRVCWFRLRRFICWITEREFMSLCVLGPALLIFGRFLLLVFMLESRSLCWLVFLTQASGPSTQSVKAPLSVSLFAEDLTHTLSYWPLEKSPSCFFMESDCFHSFLDLVEEQRLFVGSKFHFEHLIQIWLVKRSPKDDLST